MKKKWILVSDTHASLRLPHAKVSADATESDRLNDVLEVFDDIAYEAEHESPQGVFILGDLFHERHPDAPTLTAVARKLREIADHCPVTILPGNHDAHGKHADVYSISMFEELGAPGISVASQPSWWVECGVAFAFMPWVPEDLFEERLDDLLEDGRLCLQVCDAEHMVLLMHQTITGANSNGRKLSGVKSKPLTDKFDLVISGHIHQPQQLGPKIQYLGSPLPLSFSEADGLDRGWWTLDEDLGLEQTVGEDSPEFLRWRFRPGFGIDLVDAYEEVIEDLDAELLETCTLREVYLDVRVSGPRKAVDYVADDVAGRIAMYSNVRFHRLNRVVTDDGSERVRAAIEEQGGATLTPKDLVRLYAEGNEETIPDDVEFDDLAKLGQELLAKPLTEVFK